MSFMYLVSQWRHNSTGLYRLEKVKLLIELSTNDLILKLSQDCPPPPGSYPIRTQIILLKNDWISPCSLRNPE